MAEETAASSAEAPANDSDQAPKPRRRRTKKAAESAESAGVETPQLFDMPAPEEAQTEKRSRPRRRGAKAEADTAPSAGERGEGAPEPTQSEAPDAERPRSRRGRKAGDPMTQLTQEATKASSSLTPMPATTLAEADRAAAGADDPAREARKSDKRQRAAKAAKEKGESADEGRTDGGQQGETASSRRRRHNNAPNGNAQGKGARQSQGRRRNRRNQFDSPAQPTLTREELQDMKVAELRARASELGLESAGVRKPDLVESIYKAAAAAEGFRGVDGILEIGNEGYGWVRTGNYMPGDDDAFVHQQLIKSYGLRPGDRVKGTVGPGRANSKYPPLQTVEAINGRSPEEMRHRPRFRDLTPIYPNEPLVMEHGKNSITGRAIDLVAPIGKGQRGLIVSPPKAGKTTVLKKICQSIATNNPEVNLVCLLVDERPEEVTDMERSIEGEVVASTFDMPAENHTAVSELVIEHAKRLVEQGEDVVVVLDSITRLARAYNLAQPASGRILSGGVDSAALYPPKKFLGAARNIENGGSLTIIASALVDTGSKMDEVIFEEFKGTGNMELKLDRDLADKRIFPAIDPVASGTRNEELLLPPDMTPFIWGIRRVLANMNNTERAATALVKGLKATDSNEEFLIRSARKAQQSEYAL